MKKRKLILAALALVLVACVSIGSALAYFTDYAVVKGGHPLALVPWTEITEKPTTGSKEVSITNYGEAPCWVRVKAFADGTVTNLAASGSGWSGTLPDYVTCGSVVMPGGTAPTLMVTFTLPSPADAETANVIVVYESVPAFIDPETGEYLAANWSESAILYEESVGTDGGQG